MTRTIRAELVLEARARHGEGPVWHPTEHTLDWVDIMAGHLHRYDPRTDRDDVIDVGRPIGAFAPRRSGGYVLALEHGFGVLEPSGEVRVVASIETPGPPQRMNDGKCDSAGRFWAGTMAYDFTPGVAALYRLDAAFKVTTMLKGITLSNGLDWTDDDRTMCYIDSLTHGIDAFDFDPATGSISGRRRLIDVPPDRTGQTVETVPDGMTLDAEGYLWVAIHGASEVRRYSPQGEMECIVRLPVCGVTSCTFGGEQLTDLYITSMVVFDDGREPLAGALFRCAPGVTGRPARLFGG
jgi:sugar lactone lactonase YvrE